jgi:hypothetical protein
VGMVKGHQVNHVLNNNYWMDLAKQWMAAIQVQSMTISGPLPKIILIGKRLCTIFDTFGNNLSVLEYQRFTLEKVVS